MDNTKKSKKKLLISPFIGIASVWFGTHVGPGIASGKQVVSYFASFGKLGIITPIVAMAVLGYAIYLSLEYSRVNDTHNFRAFTNKFFHPYEKIFSTFFEICFLVTSLLAPGLCIATSANLFNQFFGLNVWIGTGIMVLLSIILVIYGAELVKAASTGLTVGILAVLITIIFLGIRTGGANLERYWTSSSIKDVSIFNAIWIAISYAGFQSTGIIGNCISVSQGLKSRSEAVKTAILGVILNGLMLASIVLVNYAFQPESIASNLPNYYIVQQLGYPVLETVYVFFVAMASLSTIITFAFALCARYGNKEILVEKIKNDKSRNLFIVAVMLILDILVSTLGIAPIVNIGYRALGYFSIFVVLIPIVFVGIRKNKYTK